MLLGLLLIGVKAGTFDMVALATDNGRGLTHTTQVIAVLADRLGLAVKTPMWPLHSWLPDAHTAAPTVGSVLLAGVLLKMGTYGFVRIAAARSPRTACTPSRPTSPPSPSSASSTDRSPAWPWPAGREGDLKRLIAYSSVGHMGFVLLGIATLTPTGVNGALFANIAHGLITGLLFFLVGALKDRYGTTDLDTLAGASAPPSTAGRPASAACSPSPPSPRSDCPAWPDSGARCWRMFGAFHPAARPQPPRLPHLHGRSPRSAPCSPPPTCWPSCAGSAWAQTAAGEPRPGTPPPTCGATSSSPGRPLVALTVLAGLWPAALLGLTDPAVQQLLAGGS